MLAGQLTFEHELHRGPLLADVRVQLNQATGLDAAQQRGANRSVVLQRNCFVRRLGHSPPHAFSAPGSVQRGGTTGNEMLALIVDDDPALRFLVAEVLRDDGLETQTAGNGVEALQLVDQGVAPDVIITDLAMPGFDGRRLVYALRERGVRAPILLLSAFGARAALREIPADAALDKPFDIDVLRSRVLELVEGADGSS